MADPAPARLAVACTTEGCKQNGVERVITLAYAAMGVIALPRYVCAHCSTDLAVTWLGREASDG